MGKLTTSNFDSNLRTKLQTKTNTPQKAQTYREIRAKYVVTEELPCETIPELPGKKAMTPSVNKISNKNTKNENVKAIDVPNIQTNVKNSHKKTNSLLSDRPVQDDVREKINLRNELIFESQLTDPSSISESLIEVNLEPDVTKSTDFYNQKLNASQ